MTIEPMFTAAIVASSLLAALSGTASAGGNYYGSHPSSMVVTAMWISGPQTPTRISPFMTANG